MWILRRMTRTVKKGTGSILVEVYLIERIVEPYISQLAVIDLCCPLK